MTNADPNFLYVLSEDDDDDLFYEMCASRICSKSFQLVDRRIRKNGGINAVRTAMRPFLNDLRGVVGLSAYFIIALDNDRAPNHQNNHQRINGLSNRDRSKACRVCEIEQTIMAEWGSNAAKWPAKGAVAVPVEMLETWLIVALDPACAGALPPFPAKSKSAANAFYGGSPPDQLKDLFDTNFAASTESNKSEFILQIANDLDLAGLASASPSFAHFQQQVLQW